MKYLDQRKLHLKIKIKTLAAETLIIKAREKKFKWENDTEKNSWPRRGLVEHRKNVVRPATRVNHLAYGMLRGVPYSSMEKKCNEVPDFDKVWKIARSFGASESDISAWQRAAQDYIKSCVMSSGTEQVA